MTELQLRDLIESVRHGHTTRREFISALLGLGIAAPIASQLLLHAGVAQAQAASDYKPTRRGGGGPLKVLWWQGPTLLNPHFATGTKEADGSRIFYEPLASWNGDGGLVPTLAAEIPTLANGGLSRDGKTVTWKLKKDVLWHDGKPFTSADVVFNWEYASDPATAAVTLGAYGDMKVVAVDPWTVRVEFATASPFWAGPFVGSRGMLIPKHVFDNYRGAKSRDAPANLKPVGTGPYKFASFAPGDMLTGTLNAQYHQPHRPYFDTIEMKGGGDAVSAARAVLQTGEFDYAWNLQVEDEILQRLEQGGKGRVNVTVGGGVEFILFNFTDPWTEVDGERSSIKTRHPTLTDPAVREALTLLIDRAAIQQYIFGRAGVATANYIDAPVRFRSPNNKFEFSIDRATRLLDQAGWKTGGDGVRGKDGKKLKFVFQTSVNQPRQKAQSIIKQACQKAGIEMELKSVVASVFFSSDVANPDTNRKFYSDIQMYSVSMTRPDPGLAMNSFSSWEIASKANKWLNANVTRWRNDEYDKTYRAAEVELDPVKRAALIIRLNDLIVQNHVVVPVVARSQMSASSNKLRVPQSGWDSEFWALQDWHREA